MSWDGMERRQPERFMERLDILLEKVNQMEKDFAIVKSFINSENGNHIHHLDVHHTSIEKLVNTVYGEGTEAGLTHHVLANREAMKILNADMVAHKTNVKWIITFIFATLVGIVVKMSWPG